MHSVTECSYKYYVIISWWFPTVVNSDMPPASFRQTSGLGRVGVLLFLKVTDSVCCSWNVKRLISLLLKDIQYRWKWSEIMRIFELLLTTVTATQGTYKSWQSLETFYPPRVFTALLLILSAQTLKLEFSQGRPFTSISSSHWTNPCPTGQKHLLILLLLLRWNDLGLLGVGKMLTKPFEEFCFVLFVFSQYSAPGDKESSGRRTSTVTASSFGAFLFMCEAAALQLFSAQMVH